MSALPRVFFTEEQYLALERNAESKHEYLRGEIYAMAGVSRTHSLISSNLNGELRQALRKRQCEAHAGDVRVRVSETGLYTYPDVLVACEPVDFLDDYVDTLLNPIIIFEVLSPSTEKYDRGEKFAHYRRLPSLKTYVLVSQDKARIEVFERQPDDRWLLTEYSGLEGTIYFPAIDVNLNLADIYERVTFAAEQDDEHSTDNR